MAKDVELTITVTMDEEQLETLRLYMPADAQTLDAQLTEAACRTLQRLFTKNVPLPVQNYLAKKNGLPPVKPERPRPPRKPAGERKKRGQGGQGQAMTPEPDAPAQRKEQAQAMG